MIRYYLHSGEKNYSRISHSNLMQAKLVHNYALMNIIFRKWQFSAFLKLLKKKSFFYFKRNFIAMKTRYTSVIWQNAYLDMVVLSERPICHITHDMQYVKFVSDIF